MKESVSVIAKSIAGLLAGALSTAAIAANEGIVYCAEKERCYGVSKAGRNDCATATSACAGTAAKDSQKDAWVYVPKGTCEKLAGASQPPAAAPKKK